MEQRIVVARAADGASVQVLVHCARNCCSLTLVISIFLWNFDSPRDLFAVNFEGTGIEPNRIRGT